VAYKFKCRHLTPHDLIQAGSIGLIRSIRKFQPERGFRLFTFCKQEVYEAVERHVSSQNMVLSLSRREYKEDYSRITYSGFDDWLGGGKLSDRIPDAQVAMPYENLNKQEDTADMLSLLNQLKPEQREVVDLHLGLNGDKPLSFAEVGKRVGQSKQLVSLRYQTAVKKLRKIVAENNMFEKWRSYLLG